jgi:hypothetical protein
MLPRNQDPLKTNQDLEVPNQDTNQDLLVNKSGSERKWLANTWNLNALSLTHPFTKRGRSY